VHSRIFSARRSKINISLVPRAVSRGKNESTPANQQAPSGTGNGEPSSVTRISNDDFRKLLARKYDYCKTPCVYSVIIYPTNYCDRLFRSIKRLRKHKINRGKLFDQQINGNYNSCSRSFQVSQTYKYPSASNINPLG
jgi:hypothetical protein